MVWKNLFYVIVLFYVYMFILIFREFIVKQFYGWFHLEEIVSEAVNKIYGAR